MQRIKISCLFIALAFFSHQDLEANYQLVLQILPKETIKDKYGAHHFETVLQYSGKKKSITRVFMTSDSDYRDIGIEGFLQETIDPDIPLIIKFGKKELSFPNDMLEKLKCYLVKGPKSCFIFERLNAEQDSEQFFTCFQFAYSIAPDNRVEILGPDESPHHRASVSCFPINQDLSDCKPGDVIFFIFYDSSKDPSKQPIHSAIFIKKRRDNDPLLLSKLGEGPLAFSKLSQLKKVYPSANTLVRIIKIELTRNS